MRASSEEAHPPRAWARRGRRGPRLRTSAPPAGPTGPGATMHLSAHHSTWNHGRTGIWFIGARGSVATTATLGLAAIATGLAAPRAASRRRLRSTTSRCRLHRPRGGRPRHQRHPSPRRPSSSSRPG
ncbi:hypothetical protein NKG05_17725 [Oerskovia sp. M15]